MNLHNSDAQMRATRRTRILIQVGIVVILAVPFILSFTTHAPYQNILLDAVNILLGLFLMTGGIFHTTLFADAIGVRSARTRSRNFYIIFGCIFFALGVIGLVNTLR